MADLTANAGATFEAGLDGAPTGLTGILTVGIYDTPGELVALYGPSPAGIVENPTGSGLYAVTLTAPATTGVYSVVWNNQGVTTRDTLTVSGAIDTPYFTLTELRDADPALADTARFTAAALEEMRVLVESALEDACGVAFVPRYASETVSGDHSTRIVLSRPRVTAVSSVKHDGIAVIDLNTVMPSPSGILYYPSGWARGFGNYQITYEHGYATPPPRVKRAALILAKVWLLAGPVSDRATQVPAGDGSALNLATPGFLGSRFGIPEVDQVVREYAMTVAVA